MLETFLRDFAPYSHDSITQLLQICWLLILDVNLPHPKDALLDWDLVTVEAIWAQWTENHLQDTRCAHLWSERDGHGLERYSDSLRHLKNAQLVLRGWKLHYNTAISLNRWGADGWMFLCCLQQILTLLSECHSPNRDLSNHATFFQSSAVQLDNASGNNSLSFLFFAVRSSTHCGLLLFQGLRCWGAFRDVFLHTVVELLSPSYQLEAIFLFIFLWPMASTSHFHIQNYSSLDVFSFSDHFL